MSEIRSTTTIGKFSDGDTARRASGDKSTEMRLGLADRLPTISSATTAVNDQALSIYKNPSIASRKVGYRRKLHPFTTRYYGLSRAHIALIWSAA
jgi:hypothetical protein